MAAVAHASPADFRRLSLVVAGSAPRPVPSPLPATVYRRRRVTALLVVLLALASLGVGGRIALGALGGGPLTASGRPGPAPATVYVVQPGDTFWGIARRLAPGEDPRPLVAELVAAHGGASLVAGERLRLPLRS